MVATVIYRPMMFRSMTNWKVAQHTIQSYDYSTGERIVLEGFFQAVIESIKYTTNHILVWAGNFGYYGHYIDPDWQIPSSSLSVWCRKTGKLVRIIYPHENRKSKLSRLVNASSFLNMQSSSNDRAWMTFRYTSSGLYRDGFKSAILIDLNTGRIERQLFGEVAASFHDGTIEYLAVHKPDLFTGESEPHRNVVTNEPLENTSTSYSVIHLMMDFEGKIEPMCPTPIKAELIRHPNARFDRDALQFWQNEVQIFFATQVERRLIEIYFWHKADVKVNQTAVLKLVRVDVATILPMKHIGDETKVNAMVVRGYLPGENHILVNAECLLGVDTDDVGIITPFIRHNFELKIDGICDEKMKQILRQGSNCRMFEKIVFF